MLKANSNKRFCYFCGLPRYPWAVIAEDFSETVCRSCVNYEGHERIPGIIDVMRTMKKEIALTAVTTDRIFETSLGLSRCQEVQKNSDPSPSIPGPSQMKGPTWEKLRVGGGHVTTPTDMVGAESDSISVSQIGLLGFWHSPAPNTGTVKLHTLRKQTWK